MAPPLGKRRTRASRVEANAAEYKDEIDKFHDARRALPSKKIRGVVSRGEDEEVLRMEESSEEEEEAEEEQMSDSDIASGEEREDDEQLPAADSWGSKRSAYYSTDYVDADRGRGFEDSDDEEAAELEEQEVLALQRKQAAGLSEWDFELDGLEDAEVQEAGAKVDEMVPSQEDLAALSTDEQILLLRRQSPELFPLIEEWRAARSRIGEVKPLLQNRTTRNPIVELLRLQHDTLHCYFLNISFYFLLKVKNIESRDHPVLDRIMQFRNLLDKLNEQLAPYEDEIAELLRKVNEPLVFEEPADVEESSKADEVKEESDITPTEGEESDIEGEEGGKRKATYQMVKNKSLVPRRKKEQRNARVKHRKKFRKATIKRRVQVAEVKRESKRYGGEERGIRAGLVRSVKLK